MGSDLREPSLRRLAEAIEDGACDRKLENAVPEELEAFVRIGAVVGPRRVGEDVVEPVRRELVDQPAELGRPIGDRRATPGAR
jgi:hypothetical protein